MNARAQAVGGPLFTRTYLVALFLLAVGLVLLGWRFAQGLGAVTGLNDGYPWGIWIAFDVVTGTAIGTGGYAVAILVYVFNKGQFHPLVRPAVLTSALGYTMAALAIVIDVGRYWNIWKIPLYVTSWNTNSALLEVALCVMSYVVVLYVELSPAVLEKWQQAGGGKAKFANSVLPALDKALPWILALGILLPTMHQSSLGAIFLLSTKLHGLWHTPFLPLLFLLSCLGMGYGTVIYEAHLARMAFGRQSETKMLATLGKVMAGVLAVYLALRLGDLAARGRLGMAFAFDRFSVMFLLEMFAFVFALVVLLIPGARNSSRGQWFAAGAMLAGGALYRFDTYLVGFNPGATWHYFPTVPEIFVTVGIVALEFSIYFFMVKRFPILGGAAAHSKG